MGQTDWEDSFFPSTLGSYQLDGQIGSGTFGEVQRATHCTTGQRVALKQVYVKQPARGPSGLTHPEDAALREIKALRTINHPHVVTLHDVFTKDDTHVLVMELCCTDLAAALDHAKVGWDEALIRGLLRQLLQGVAACHNTGYLHRDLKPANLLLTEEGLLKVGDLGQSRPHDARPGTGRAAAYTAAVATRWYRAPELLLGSRSYGPAADMWAVGCILAEMLGMCPLFSGDSDFDQLGRLVEVLGSISTRTWPEVQHMPDFHKLCFKDAPAAEWNEVFPDASSEAVDLLSHLVQWNPEQRLTAEEALQHSFLSKGSVPLELEECRQLAAWTASAQAASKNRRPRA
ncbi:g13307 [Coccomyxa viridis]|uniref:cyclin-dependent kinase n=1 Tax=Coccomyxa viridis TaxID=1274662 RepID=A0ABP1GF24_9CHLO